jgi:hypothetical protein
MSDQKRSFSFLRLAALAMLMITVSVAGVWASDELESTPLEIPYIPQEGVSDDEAASSDFSVDGPVEPSLVTIGLNFQGSQLSVDSGFIPPDTMGAVGPDDIVELINGRFDVYDKTTGMQIDTDDLFDFWTVRVGLPNPPANPCDLGAGICTLSRNACTSNANCRNNTLVDPRVVYDPDTGRWFAASIDLFANNNIYVGRTDTDDPTGTWRGVRFAADTVGVAEFHDYPTLALDADGVYICTQDFDRGFGGGGVESCYSIPKADLLPAAPSVANMTRFESSPAGLPTVSGSVQANLDFGVSDGRAALLGVNGGAIVRSDILGAGGAGATLGTPTGIAGDPGHAGPPDARQPHPTDPSVLIENVAPRFVGNVFELGNSLWAVHSVQGSSGSNSALRWYQIDEPSNVLVQTGLIDNPNEDYHEPSIAVNPFGNVVIGYTCSGPNLAASACVSVGETVGGTTTFEDRMILQVGDGHYYNDGINRTGRNRWGDYSATVIDPADQCTFWTFQEFVAVSAVGNVGPSPRPNGGSWGIQVTELVIDAPVATIPGDVEFEDTCLGDTSTETLEVCNTTPNDGPCANLVVHGITSSDPEFAVTEPSSGFPVVISPDFCFPFEVKFTPVTAGAKSGVLTVETNDPSAAAVDVNVSGEATEPEIRVTGSPDFGDVCAETLAEKTIKVCNVGPCDLFVASATINCDDFTIMTNPFPAIVSPDSCLDLVIRFTPTTAGPKTCQLEILSNDPPAVLVDLTANTPLASIDVPPAQSFPPTVIQSVGECVSKNPFPVSNTGSCNLDITDFSITTNPDEFALDGVPSFPIILGPGDVAGEGDLRTVFGPEEIDRDRLGAVTVTYVSEPITGATTEVSRALCGEGVRTGARMLVTHNGMPLTAVKSIKLQRLGGNRNLKIVDTVDVAKNVPLNMVMPAAPCEPFVFHREYGGDSNPIQLLPGSYLVTVQARINGKNMRQSVAFDVSTCDFNPNIVVMF